MALAIYKRPNSPYWWAKVPVFDGAGKLLDYERYSTKRTVKAEALIVAQHAIKKALDRKQIGALEEATIYDVAQRYLEECYDRPVARDYQSHLKRLFEGTKCSDSALSKTDLMSSLSTAVVKRIVTQRQREGLKANTINNEIAFMSAFYTKAKTEYEIVVDHTAVFKKLKAEAKLRYLMGDEEARLLKELDPTREIPFMPEFAERNMSVRKAMQDQFDLVVFLLDTGARFGEVASIMWSDIDTMSWKSINIYRSKVGNEGTIHLTNRLRDILQRRFSERRNSPYVFPSPTNAMSARGYATHGIAKAIDRAGLNAPHLVKRYGRFTTHCLRHTFASKLVQNGVSLYTVSKLLGHASTQMTQRYAHLCVDSAAENAAAILDQLEGDHD